jgi:hypothetical protein
MKRTGRQTSGGPSPVQRIRVIKAAAGVPLGALIAVCRDFSRILDHPRHVHQIPGHERRIAIREVILRSTRSRIQVGGSGPHGPQPPGIGTLRCLSHSGHVPTQPIRINWVLRQSGPCAPVSCQPFQSIVLVARLASKTISPLRPVMTFLMLRMSSTGMVK